MQQFKQVKNEGEFLTLHFPDRPPFERLSLFLTSILAWHWLSELSPPSWQCRHQLQLSGISSSSWWHPVIKNNIYKMLFFSIFSIFKFKKIIFFLIKQLNDLSQKIKLEAAKYSSFLFYPLAKTKTIVFFCLKLYI